MQSPGTNDEELAREAAAGRRDAFEELVSRFGGAVLAVLERQVNDHHLARDLAQEVWIKVFRAIRRYRPEGSFRSWLFSIVLNHGRDAERRRKRNKVVYLDDFRSVRPAAGPEDPLASADEKAVIAAALERVDEPFRSALTLVDVLQLSYDEAAKSLDCAVGTVKSRVNRGRFAFRDLYLKLSGDSLSPGRNRSGGPVP